MISRIDCDVHPSIESTDVLLPYLDDYWREQLTMRGLEHMDLAPFKPALPTTARADWRGPSGRGALTVEAMARQILDPQGIDIAVCNVVYGGSSLFNPYMGAAVCSAINDWLTKQWLDRDARLRGSIVVPVQDVELAVKELDRIAPDRRFVQVLMPAAGDMPFGRKYYWPIYEAAVKHGLPVAFHPGGGVRFPATYVGYASSFSEDYILQAQVLGGQLLSLIHEGVFQQFPELRVVMLETGISWLPAFLTDADNKWMALRREVPWVTESPSDIVRRHVRFSTQPFDVPGGGEHAARIVEMLGSDDLFLFSTDYPHWRFEGDDPFPPGISAEFREKITSVNPLATYRRIEGAAA